MLNERKSESTTGNIRAFRQKPNVFFELFNNSKCFDRHALVKYFEELRRHDLKNEMLPVEDEVFHNLEFLFYSSRQFILSWLM